MGKREGGSREREKGNAAERGNGGEKNLGKQEEKGRPRRDVCGKGAGEGNKALAQQVTKGFRESLGQAGVLEGWGGLWSTPACLGALRCLKRTFCFLTKSRHQTSGLGQHENKTSGTTSSIISFSY